MAKTFQVDEVRRHFPALSREYKGRSVAYLDGPGGSQVVDFAIDAMADYMRRGGANLHGVFPSSVETDALLTQARGHAAALLGADASEIAFGPNMTTLNLAISRALARTWNEGDEVVVTELDHRANVDPFLHSASDRGAQVRWLEVNPETLTLDFTRLEETITERTKLVAVGLASNGVGSITDVARVAKRAHEVGALVVVDAVHATPHMVIDRNALGADILLCSAYKFFGPHVGIACIRANLFEDLNPYKLKPAPTYIPDKLETGTQSHEGLAGVVACIEFIASLGERDSLHEGNGDGNRNGEGSGECGGLREQIVQGVASFETHEEALARRIRKGLAEMPHVRSYVAGPEARKTPTMAFTVDGVDSRTVCERLLESHALFVADGDFYASTLAEKLGVKAHGGWVRAGLAPYNTEAEVDALLEGLEALKRR